MYHYGVLYGYVSCKGEENAKIKSARLCTMAFSDLDNLLMDVVSYSTVFVRCSAAAVHRWLCGSSSSSCCCRCCSLRRRSCYCCCSCR